MEQTANPKPTFIEAASRLLPAIIVVGSAFASYVLMSNEVKILRRDFEALKEQVVRQYGTQRDMNEKTNNEVQALREWVEYHKGYEQARKDYEIKP